MNDVYNNIMERSLFINNILQTIERGYPDAKIIDNKLTYGELKIDIDDLFKVYEMSLDKTDPMILIQDFMESISSVFVNKDQINLKSILPRIYSKNFVDKNGIDSGIKYVNNTIIVPVINFKFFFLPVTKALLNKSNIHDDELLLRIMKSNLAETLDFKMNIINGPDNYKTIILINNDGFAPSFILMDGIYNKISEELGNTYYVGIPDRDIFIAANKEASGKLKYNIKKFYEQSQNKISKNSFTVTMDGVAGSVLKEKE